MSAGCPSEHWPDLLRSIEQGLYSNATEEERRADRLFPLVVLEETYE